MYRPDRLSPPLESVEEIAFTPDLKGFCDWLETQDPSTKYAAMSPDDCVMCRFHTAVEGRPMRWGQFDWTGREGFKIWHAVHGQKTYGAALKRAREALASRS